MPINPIIIRDVIVADPSLSVTFTYENNSEGTLTSIRNFEAHFFLNNINENADQFVLVAKVFVHMLGFGTSYISVPFGDTTYAPGQEFTLIVQFLGQDNVTGNPFYYKTELQVISGGMVVGNGVEKKALVS